MVELLRELFHFLHHTKKYWLLPIIVVLVLTGALLVFAPGSVLGPFIYALF